MKKSAERRREEIVEMIRERGKIRVGELCEIYGVSEVSVRKDLELLEAEGHLTRVHGGAVGQNKLYINMDVGERYRTNAAAKRAIAELAARYIEDNDTVMMNAGTTMTYVLRAIRGRKNISIVTNSVQNATEAALYPDFNVILLGGELDAKYQFTHGRDAERQIDGYHAAKCILSVDGISASAGLTLYYSNEASLARRMIESSSRTIVVADGTKLGKSAFARVGGAELADVLITSDSDRLGEIRALELLGIRVEKA